jgi:hypothetical protein
MMRFWFGFIGPFVSGMVVAINLDVLLEAPPNHEGDWWRVCLAVFIGIGCWAIGKQT